MVKNLCFLDSVSEFENIKRQAARFYFNRNDEPYEIQKVFGDNPTETETLAFHSVQNAFARYNSIAFPDGLFLSFAPKTNEEYVALRDKANAGDDFCYMVGAWCYWRQKQFGETLRMFKELANVGHSEAYVGLGWLYRRGEGVETDVAKAISYYEQAVLIDGNDEALNELGQYYLYSKNDREKALALYERSARQGNAMAMYQLGWIYSRMGQKQESIKWYIRSATCGFSEAFDIVIQHNFDKGDYEMAFQGAQVYARTEMAHAYTILGHFYIDGIGVEKDFEKGVELLKKAADKGDARALTVLSKAYNDSDYQKSWEYVWLASQKHEPEAEYVVGMNVWDKDREMATQLLHDSAAQGFEAARQFLKENGLQEPSAEA
ncbi:MAG: sel1 repeat family protein [Bacteroidales bacterium]|nr:sel1 repeat family protein [Bacteroidales bacterium]